MREVIFPLLFKGGKSFGQLSATNSVTHRHKSKKCFWNSICHLSPFVCTVLYSSNVKTNSNPIWYVGVFYSNLEIYIYIYSVSLLNNFTPLKEIFFEGLYQNVNKFRANQQYRNPGG